MDEGIDTALVERDVRGEAEVAERGLSGHATPGAGPYQDLPRQEADGRYGGVRLVGVASLYAPSSRTRRIPWRSRISFCPLPPSV